MDSIPAPGRKIWRWAHRLWFRIGIDFDSAGHILPAVEGRGYFDSRAFAEVIANVHRVGIKTDVVTFSLAWIDNHERTGMQIEMSHMADKNKCISGCGQ